MEGFDVKDLRAHTNYAGGYHSVSSFYVLRWRLPIISSVFIYQQLPNWVVQGSVQVFVYYYPKKKKKLSAV